MTSQTPTPKLSQVLNAGCAVLHERVPEAYEPEWRELLMRAYLAMSDAYRRIDGEAVEDKNP